MLTAALLHDILEDVNWISEDYLTKEFNKEIFTVIDNLSKRKGEEIEDYINRVSSHKISAIVKIADRLNNVSTLSESSQKHRKKQLLETREVYLPLVKHYRREYFEYSSFFWQARTIMVALLNEVERGVLAEEKLDDLMRE